jgi:hypothetical protein
MRRLAGLAALMVLASGCTGGGAGPALAPPAGGQSTAMVDCLADKGWEVIANPDGSYTAGVPAEQAGQFQAAETECIVELGLDQPWTLTETEAAAYFDALVAAAECLRDEFGYDIPEPPSRQSAIEEIMVPPIDLGWDPYAGPMLGATTGEELEAIFTTCPRPELF